ncbi:Acyl-coenzyme A oxidase 4 [Fusarium oxysporum f. sp. cubense race 1]|uniref:Acyl-coenzyme A oxidase 4 n=1 Tax=Fusarium oxysporum f. sp. cubense (strain race 1) TaxID=1229664 RepID=N4TSY5_FUSC1|nr:Acyl-coenzyme A oxidase 4 [Fusarium oxysporum f. sp. cubense race 1]
MFQSKAILTQNIWHRDHDIVAPASRRDISIHYERAKSIWLQSGLSQHDIKNLTPKFWNFHFDRRPDLQDILDKLLSFDICGEFMLTEVGHGLDARNLETTATLLPDGSYDLDTPHAGAAKAMPPTTPCCNMPRLAIVFARLIIDGESHGVKPFLVFLSDARGMRPGITSRILPTRPALLGSTAKPENDRLAFLRHIWRIAAGTLSLSIMGISAIKVGTRIAAVYSERRTIAAADGEEGKRIMAFSTQQHPIVEGWVQGKVLHAFAQWTIDMCPDLSDPTQHALASIFKATGNAIAEGDTLVLCIRFMSELLGGKLELPRARNRLSRLAQCEERLMADMTSRLKRIGGYKEHRGLAFDRHILPRCRPLAESIGNRMAYEAAEKWGLPSEVLTLYERICMGEDLDPLHMVEPLAQEHLPSRSSAPYNTVLAQIRSESVSQSDIDHYVTAPITSDKSWESFMNSLHAFKSPEEFITPLSKL